ncbi:hypothetical protein RUND412_009212 [Rhizina undulata]
MVNFVEFMLPIRAVQGVFALIVLATAASVVDGFGNHKALHVDNSSTNFMIFNAIWTWIALGYLIATPKYFPDLHNTWAVMGVNAVSVIFWFSGFIAQAVSIHHMKSACSHTKGCPIGSANASATFGAFEWLLWTASLGLVIHAFLEFGKDELPGGGIGPGDVSSEGNNTSPGGEGGGAFSSLPVLPDPVADGNNELDIEMNALQRQHHQSEYPEAFIIATTSTTNEQLGVLQPITSGPPAESDGVIQMPAAAHYGGHGGL